MTTSRIPRQASTAVITAAYAATIPAANWMIGNVGTQHAPGAPHVIPVGFGYEAPSGVLLIGLALVLRDLIQERVGIRGAIAAIICGVVVSFAVADPAIAVASAVAFCAGEMADLTIYTPLRKRNRPVAVALSGFVGGVADSLLFLTVAFGSTTFWEGQVIGKTIIAAAAAVTVWGAGALSHRVAARKP